MDSENAESRKVSVTLLTKAMKSYPKPNLSSVAPLDAHTADAIAEQTQFDQTLERREK